MLPYIPNEIQKINDTLATVAVELNQGQSATFQVPRGAAYVELYSTQPVFVKNESADSDIALDNAVHIPTPVRLQYWFNQPITGTTNTGLDSAVTYTFYVYGGLFSIAGSAAQTLADLFTALSGINGDLTWALKNVYGMVRTASDTDIAYVEVFDHNNYQQYLLPSDGTLWPAITFFDKLVCANFAQPVTPQFVGELIPANVRIVKRLDPTQTVLGITTTRAATSLALVSASFLTQSC